MEVNDAFIWKVNSKRNHSFLLPKDIRGIIVGKSGFGKTVLLTFLLLEPGVLDYNNIIVCGQSLHQPEYKVMQAAFKKGLSKSQIKVLFECQDEVIEQGGIENVIQDYDGPCRGDITATFNSDASTIPDPKSYDSTRKNMLILDDIMLGPQNKVEQFFTRGRHSNFNVYYIAQNYFCLPRRTIRENSNIFHFFKQDSKNLSHIFHDHCAADGISFTIFFTFCTNVWNESKHNFITIDLTKPVQCGKYRKNLSEYWSPKYDTLMEVLKDC